MDEPLTEKEEIVTEEGDTITCNDCGKVDCMCYEDAIEHAREETITNNIFS